jgi:hypothetical protein
MFSNGSWAVNVTTVGEMVDELSRLPKDMPVQGVLEDTVDAVIMNRRYASAFVAFEEGGEWTAEEE